MYSKVENKPSRMANRFLHSTKGYPKQSQPFTDEELLAIELMCQNSVRILQSPETTHDLGALEFGKAVRGVLSKLER